MKKRLRKTTEIKRGETQESRYTKLIIYKYWAKKWRKKKRDEEFNIYFNLYKKGIGKVRRKRIVVKKKKAERWGSKNRNLTKNKET
jgi:hypothetical protein